MRFRDRGDAAEQLAGELRGLADRSDAIVLGLPRGGVPIARVVGDALGIAIDALVVRKLGVPGQPELAFGAIAGGGVQVLNRGVVAATGLSERQIDEVVARERAELERRQSAYAATGAVRALTIVVDDGIATGATMHAAAQAVREAGARLVVCAAPVGSRPAVQRLRTVADEVRVVHLPDYFGAVINFYDDFSEVTDDDVRAALSR
ncbi:MAG TPA: phosphoribosyltransferase family protein [Mycobacteriales bacterium]|nr:phosphoribosyltransferase family protein [Mycobacteriales bacterium]